MLSGSRELMVVQCKERGRHLSVVSVVNYWIQITQALNAILGILDFILGTMEGRH